MAASGVTPESNTNGYTDRKVSCTTHARAHNTYTNVVCVTDVDYVFVIQDQSILERWQHFADLADFALAMKVTLGNLNKQSFNNFMLRIGQQTSD